MARTSAGQATTEHATTEHGTTTRFSRRARPSLGAARKAWTWRALLRSAALVVAVVMLVRTFSHADLRAAAGMIARSGPAVLLGFLPFAVTMGIDAFVQKTLLRAIGQRTRYAGLYVVRLVTEALSTSLPAGVVFAESAGPLLLERQCDVAIDASIVANTTKRWLTIRAHSFYIALSVVLGYAALARVSSTRWSEHVLPMLVGALSAALFCASAVIGALLAGRAWPQRAAERLSSLPIARLRTWIEERHEKVAALDHRFAGLTGDKRTLALATATLVGAWLMESLETWLLLRLLGASLGFADVIAFEAGLSLVRSAVFFVPAGLGVQDLGYLAFLTALGVPDAATLGAAFVALKRAKEAFWVITGWGLAGLLMLSPVPAPRVKLSEEVLS